jgi:DNA-binding NarL/FixJ family response regulator
VPQAGPGPNRLQRPDDLTLPHLAAARLASKASKTAAFSLKLMETTKRIQVMVADDDASFRKMLQQLLEVTPDMELVAEAIYGAEAVRLYAEHQPDILLLDINMPVMNGLDAAKEICRDFPQARIIVLSAHHTNLTWTLATDAGVAGWLAKPTRIRDLLNGIRNVHAGLTVDGQAR